MDTIALNCKSHSEMLRSEFTLAGAAMLVCLLFPSLLSTTNSLAAQEINFETDVFSIFEKHCIDCHGSDLDEGKLRLDAKNAAFNGGVSGPSIEPKRPDRSLILERILGHGDLDQMPLDEDPLSKAEIKTIRTWIEQGAVWPDEIGEKVEIGETHWAYQLPVYPKIPDTENSDWANNAIDKFVLARLESKGMGPSPIAQPGKLIRRVYLDLIGTPPSLELIASFEANPSIENFESIVDLLLASPGYGEKWTRSWLDLARYADSNGYQADQFRSVWPYRDWVINAMNSDMPFDQFTIEQLAGDLLPNATVDQKIATGFHRLTTCNVEAGVDPEENRTNQIIDRVNTTGTVWLGTTIECMQCHNHKYDPFTQKEYYQLFAFFNGTPIEVKDSGNNIQYEFVGPKMELPYSAKQASEIQNLRDRVQQIDKKITQHTPILAKGFDQWLAEVSSSKEDQNNIQDRWSTLKVKSFQSTGKPTHKVLEDGSILLGGKSPAKATYTVRFEKLPAEIYGFKLETLTHKSLPGNGPGRHHKDRPNFVLQDFKVAVVRDFGSKNRRRNGPTQNNSKSGIVREPVTLHSGRADFSQAKFDVSNLYDDDLKTGWAINPQFGKSHFATMLTNQEISFSTDDQIEIKLVQNHGAGRTIGRLRISALVNPPTQNLFPEEIQKLIKKGISRTKKENYLLREFYSMTDPVLTRLKKSKRVLEQKIDSFPRRSTLVMVEDKMRPTHLLKRGEFGKQGEKVDPATPRVLHSFQSELKKNRLGLAKWLVDAKNPLTARVMVNRWWSQFFGRALVGTSEDFGIQGDRPTHPKLLDYLAIELVRGGWSMKNVHRKIVLSATYQQSSKTSPAQQKADKLNQFYGRGPRFRMSAEMIRDSNLTAAGLMDDQMLGEPIYPPQPPNIWRHVGRNAPVYKTSSGGQRFRRGIYVVWRRSAPYADFVNFDAPDRASCIVGRPRTNTPLQALTLLNSEANVEIAKLFSKQILADSAESPIKKINNAFCKCTGRQPSVDESQKLLEYYQSLYKEFMQSESKARSIIDEPAKPGDSKLEFSSSELIAKKAAMFFVANVLLNLDETITKD